jgi:PAS domain S-box-containing protein
MHPQFFEALITIFLASFLALHTLMNGQRSRSQQLFLALIGSTLFWSVGVAMSRVSDDPRITTAAIQFAFLGVFLLPPAWYALALQLTRRRDFSPTSGTFVLLAVPSLVSFLALATNPWHLLFVRDPSMLIDGGPREWSGPIFWVWTAWAYALVLGGSLRYLAWSWRLVHNRARMRGALVCIASLLPLSGNFFHLVGGVGPDHDITALLLGVATVMLFVADWRFRLLDTLPVARRDVIEQLNDGVIVADRDGLILDMNPAAERMMNASLTDLVGMHVVRAVAAQSVDVVELDEEGFGRVIENICKSSKGFETEVENFAGRHFEVRGAGVKSPGGQVAGLFITMRDTTERNRFEEVQRDSRRAQTIASLAAGITHEVNNPLSYVRANISHVIQELSEASDGAKDGVSLDELRAVLEEALEGADRISKIVERVRRFTDTRSGERETIFLPRFLEEVSRPLPRTPGAAIEFVTEVDSDLGLVFGSHDGLLEAVRNLLDNARHALRETGGMITLRARKHRLGVVRIEVEDNGPGVPEALRKEIFEPFFTTRGSEIGTGLGLSISAKLISDFGGTLSHEPVESGGARFVIELPDGSP